MRDIHVWNLLALHVPNVLPKTIFGFDLPWLRRVGRLLWPCVLFALGLAIVMFLIRRPKRSNEPATWAQSVLGAMYVWIMMTLGYGSIPHEWLTFANSYLKWDTASYAMRKNRIIHFDITRAAIADAVAAGIYVVVLVVNVAMFAMWQKRKAAEPATEGAEMPMQPSGSPLARLRARREKRVSAFGRPVTTSES
jgi:hypothetical protein